MDFIKKLFVPDVLLLRVKHTIELVRLQADLAREVAIKAQEVMSQNEKQERMVIQTVLALSGAIDAKDSYTNGHSARVADYSREIAKRTGFSETMQNDIYIMGLLHDMGKIGISDTIINKPSKLMDEGYPDGIAGEEIPAEARIIAVADAYDAMSSKRSYRGDLPQAVVRSEVEKGKGTQFDPAFAEIMLSMIDEDADYQMRER